MSRAISTFDQPYAMRSRASGPRPIGQILDELLLRLAREWPAAAPARQLGCIPLQRGLLMFRVGHA